MDERDTRTFTRNLDGFLHWKDIRGDLYSQEEQNQTNQLVELIGSMILRRKQIGMTQAEVAERAGVKQSAIARLENGNAIPRMDTLFRVIDALDLKFEVIPRDNSTSEQLHV